MNIRYFAWLREHTGVSSETLTYDPRWTSVADLVADLKTKPTQPDRYQLMYS